MVRQQIKVYARLKKELRQKSTVPYDITKKKKEYEDLMFHPVSNCVLQHPCGFRFYKIFNAKTSQDEIFQFIAKPVIHSVIEGFNGTLFAYGQTGSGKTYSITGSSKNYEDRGIIPRSIQYIFKHYENVLEKPTIYISYLEIYNEVGYDLLSTKQSRGSRILDELPRISLLEDKKGDAHIRNLSVFPVTTEQEAMRLLFLGDTNRTIAETAANEFSSRSHCIFTLYINLRDGNSANLRSSKLHVVDLAGSERVAKTQSKGSCLQEAKSINLSLHFLQQVILALSESHRSHIPYRNSMLTHILKDSLNGNCVTSMLATLSTLKGNIEESISTCRFAQRVSMIATDPIINVLDPQREIVFLKLKIEDLEKRLSSATGFTASKSISKQKMEGYLIEVQSFVGSNKKIVTVEPDMTEIQFCFNLLKIEVENKKKECVDLENSLLQQTTQLQSLNEELYKKDKEISQLKNIIDRIPEEPVPLNSDAIKPTFQLPVMEPPPEPLKISNVTPKSAIEKYNYSTAEEEERLYERFMSLPEISENLNFYKKALELKFNMAKSFAETIENCQKIINEIKQKLDLPLSWNQRNSLLPELEEQQRLYKKTLMELKGIQNETVHLQCGLKKAEVKSQHKFRIWIRELNNINKTSLPKTQLDFFKGNNCSKNDDFFWSDQIYKAAGTINNNLGDYNSFGDHKYIEKIRYTNFVEEQKQNIGCDSFLQNLPVKNTPHYFQNPYCDGSMNCDPSSTFMRDDCNENCTEKSNNCCLSRYKNQAKLNTHSDSSTQCIHCCHQFISNSTTPPNSSKSSYQNIANTDFVTKSLTNSERSFQSAPEDLIATRDSSSTINTLDNEEESLEKVVSKESNSSTRTLKNKDLMLNENLTNKKEVVEEVEKDDLNICQYFLETDTSEFKEFMKTVSLTGLAEIDEEIFNFYRSKFC